MDYANTHVKPLPSMLFFWLIHYDLAASLLFFFLLAMSRYAYSHYGESVFFF